MPLLESTPTTCRPLCRTSPGRCKSNRTGAGLDARLGGAGVLAAPRLNYNARLRHVEDAGGAAGCRVKT
jgi:hypothetical protein